MGITQPTKPPMHCRSVRRKDWDPEYNRPPKVKKIVCKFTEEELKDIKNGLFMRVIDIDRDLYWNHDAEKVKKREFTEGLVAKVEKILEHPEKQKVVEEYAPTLEILEKIKSEVDDRAMRALNERYEQGLRTAADIIKLYIDEVKANEPSETM